MSMNREQTQKSYELWLTRERRAYKLWRSRVRRLDQDDPRRGEAFRAWRKAQTMRKRRARELSNLPILHVDARGRADIIREEGVRRYAYPDSAGHATFGVGHLLHKGGVTDADRRKWGTPARPLSMAVVDSVLQQDLARFERVVRDVLRGTQFADDQGRFNVLVSFAFNIGAEGFRTSTTARQLHAGNLRAAADAMLLWDYPPELRGRRERERKRLLAG